jgi:signal transduction histidine kinase
MPRRLAVLLGGALALAALLAATLGAEAWRTGRFDEADSRRVREETVAAVRAALGGLLDGMEGEARAVAALPEVRAALAGAAGAASDPALAAVEGRGVPSRLSVEVVDRAGGLVAWDGPSFPRATGPPPDSLLTRVRVDDAGRRAVALWRPVVEGGRVLGAVRVVRLVQGAVPVRNQYLQDYDVADEWRDEIGHPFAVRFPAGRGDAETALRGPDGTALGRVEVRAPSLGALASQLRRTTRGVAAFWAVLLVGWLLAGLARLFVVEVRRARVLQGARWAWARAGGALAALVGGLVTVRYKLLAFDVPVRWLDGSRRPAALFDPALLASDLGWGALRSPGDLALSAAVLLAASGAVLFGALHYAARAAPGRARQTAGLAAVAVAVPAATWGAAVLVRHAVLDATIAYTDRTAPLLDGPTLVALGGLVAALAAAVLLVAAAVAVAGRGRGGWALPVGLAALGAGAAALSGVPPWPALALAALGAGLGVALADRPGRWTWPLTFRGVLVGVLVLAPVLYGLMREPLRERTETLLADAAFAFADARDDRVTVAVDEVLVEARDDEALRPVLLDAVTRLDSVRAAGGGDPADSTRQVLDALAEGLVRSSLLGSLADVASEVRLVGPAGDTLGSYVEGGAAPLAGPGDPLGFGAMRQTFLDRDERGFYKATRPVPDRRGLRRTAAIGPLLTDGDEAVAWVYLRTSPRTTRVATETPFPRVLVPTGLFGLDEEDLDYAEYDDGALVRSRGAGGGAPLRLDSTVYEALTDRASWLRRPETLGGRPTLAYYQRIGDDAEDVVAVRAPADDGLDVLFILLRLSLAGLAAGALVFAVGLAVRRRAGTLPARRTRFRDRVLNRFLVVGLASVALTGVVGQQVIREQSRQAVRDALRGRLAGAEAALVPALAVAPAPGAALEAVAAQRGVDVHLYDGGELVASSRRQLVRQRLIEPRLPGSVYRALYLRGEPFAFAEDRIGTFTYTTGYRALPDSTGRPAAALAVPTLSEQAAIEAGQARMVAYLFGGLLALLAAILVVAVVLAGQLTRPFGRLRAGLRAVGAGAAEEPIPVETRDEVGELVETFNAMQAALVESRRKLAAQEREGAWSTMARQVAHEIKNPLMPMKLSVQHLQRTYRPPGEEAPPDEVRFARQFERTTDMLIDQIETLNRIASDFSTFARMPMRAPERLDLSAVAEEAAALFEGPLAESGRAALALDLAGDPLPVVADREELRRVLVNLLTNALQAIPERPAPGRIRLATARAGGTAEATVEDDGTGIPEDARESVFEPSFSTKTSGMGLGLAISKRAVEAAGGEIAFETAEGVGTTFAVRLPLAAAEPPPPLAASGDGAAGDGVPAGAAENAPPPGR